MGSFRKLWDSRMLFVWLFADRNPKNKKMRDSAVCILPGKKEQLSQLILFLIFFFLCLFKPLNFLFTIQF